MHHGNSHCVSIVLLLGRGGVSLVVRLESRSPLSTLALLQLPLRRLPSFRSILLKTPSVHGGDTCVRLARRRLLLPWNVAANATLCLSPVQVSWIGHSRDRSLPPGRRPRSRRMPNMAWDHLLSLHFARWIKADCPLLPVSFPRRDGTFCSLFGPCPLASLFYKCHSVLFTILLLAHLEIHQDPVHVMTHLRRQPQETEAPPLLSQ